MSYSHLWNVKDISTYYWYIMYACVHIYPYLIQENILYIKCSAGLTINTLKASFLYLSSSHLAPDSPLVVITPEHEY